VDLVNMPIENKRRAEGIRHAAASVRRARMSEVDRLLEMLEAHCDPVIAVTDPPHHALLRGARGVARGSGDSSQRTSEASPSASARPF
jgi:hypothetical protein